MKTQIIFLWVLLTAAVLYAENIDPYDTDAQYAWGENVGWLNFEPGEGPGVHVDGDKLTGFVWGENIGWINLSCETTAYCGTVDFGVVNDGNGNLSGFAWAENVGWINFNPVVPNDPMHYGVTIDADGYFHGWAWGQNIGWIRFDSAQSWSVRVCVVTLDDLANFAADWLVTGNPPANLHPDRQVDMADFAFFAEWWQNFCPNGWPLKY